MIYKKKVLKNGLRIIVVPMPNSPSVTVMALVEAGSKYETKDKNGISHFLEHMCFKATKKRPQTIDISREFDQMGSEHNAFTDQEYTCYYAKAHLKHLDHLIDITADMYLNPTFPADEMEKEKGVIIEEINMYEDMPERMVQEVFQELLFGDQPAGWQIIGPKENIHSFKRDDFINYRKDHYVSSATAIVVTGNVDSGKVFKKVEKAFESISNNAKKEKQRVVEHQSVPQIKLKYKETDQAHIVIGVRTFDRYDRRNKTASLLAVILGQGMSSRLFEKMRNKLGICYYTHAGNAKLTDHGYFFVAAGVDKTRVEEATRGILEELVKIKEEKVSAPELRKSKDYYLGHLFLALESSDAVGSFYGTQEIFREKIKTPKEIQKEIEHVTAEDLQKVAKNIFQDKSLNMAIVGKYDESDVDNLRKILLL